jgi:hypothetical protein
MEFISKVTSYLKSKEADKLTTYILISLLVLIFVYISLLYNQSVVYFNRTPWDGTFQTLFPLRRMDVGELPGKDFFYFHGNGIPYILYPGYALLKAFGLGEILSALHSTFIINTTALFLPIYIFLKRYFPTNVSLLSIILIVVLFDFIPFVGAYLSPLFLGAPMGIRFLPHMIMAIVIGRYLSSIEGDTDKTTKFKVIPILVLSAWACIGVYLGAEQGFYAAGGSAICLFLYFVMSRKYYSAFLIPLFLILAFFTFLVLSSLVFFQSLDNLKAISVISNDQVWVFGVYPNSFFMSFKEIFSLNNMSALPSQVATLLSFFVVVVLYLCFRKAIITKIFFITILVLFFSGLLSWVSNVGYIGAHQTALLIRFLLISLVAFGFVLLKRMNIYADN